jgi:hypothetical protein
MDCVVAPVCTHVTYGFALLEHVVNYVANALWLCGLENSSRAEPLSNTQNAKMNVRAFLPARAEGLANMQTHGFPL